MLAHSGNSHSRFLVDRPQTLAVISDFFIFLTGGLNLAVSVGWSKAEYTLHFRICWYIGVAIGALIAPPLVQWKRKRIFVILPNLLVAASAIIAVSGYQYLSILIASRYIDGICIGLTTVSFITHVSEITSEHRRGFCLAFEQMALAVGIYVQMLYTALWISGTNFSPNLLMGLCNLFFGCVAAFVSYTQVDSPIQHLRNGDETSAIACINILYQPSILNENKEATLTEMKLYVAVNDAMSLEESFMKGLVPLIKMLIYRSMLSFMISLPIMLALNNSGFISAPNVINWHPILYGFLAVLGTVVASTTLGGLGRKWLSLLALLVTGGMFIGVGILYDDSSNLTNATKMSIVCALLMSAQFLSGIFAPSTTVYLGEAFPLKVKPYFIGICVIVQNMVGLIIVCIFHYKAHTEFIFCITTGVLMVVFAIAFCFTLPETRKTNLREAQEQFAEVITYKIF
ncbi:major myo-inositol transporter IolT-like [Eurosta solidaginis]|uniref:major myo-inositol transporter IolT-like n=1 Tax=Eurosta solidaginis TaxID=178769 RepID=UPI003530DC59